MKYKHVYFESKEKGRDSYFQAVRDINKPGVDTSKEVKAIAVAQFVDYLDGYTVDKESGKTKRFTPRVWAGRMKVLRILASKYGGKNFLNKIEKLRKLVDARKISKSKARKIVKKLAKKEGVNQLLFVRAHMRHIGRRRIKVRSHFRRKRK